MKGLYMIAACLLSVMCLPTAYGQSVSREKKYSGRFPADRGKLIVDNRYGKLDIRTWDRNEVTVDITVSAKGKTAAIAQELLDKVSITEPPAHGSGIHYRTEIGKGRSGSIQGEFRIDYVINMPRRHPAAFVNKYGDISLTEAGGQLSIALEYGSLRTGAIRGPEKDIRLAYGNATIASMETGSIRSSYSNLSIEKAGSIDVTGKSGTTRIGSVRELDIDQRYGDLTIGSVSGLKGSVQYAGLKVGKLLKDVKMNLQYCTGARFEYVGPDVDRIDVSSSYGNMYYRFDKAASLSGDVQVSYGNVRSSAPNVSLSRSGGGRPGQSEMYRGKIGSGRGSMAMQVSYGNIEFR